MSVLCEYAIAAYFAYFSNVHISHIFKAQIGIFEGKFGFYYLAGNALLAMHYCLAQAVFSPMVTRRFMQG